MSALLKKFRQLLKAKNLTGYVLPRTDEYQSQYLCKCDERVQFISGFTGSNGIAFISQQEALLWTDGRYFLQAQKELFEGWTLKKMLAQQKRWFQYVTEKYPKDSRIEIDARLITAEAGPSRQNTFKEKGLQLIFENRNLIDQLWDTRPKSSATDIFIHEQWAGKPITEKVKWVRDKIAQKQGNGAVFTDLSQIGWILNLRSGQIPYNPFFKSILYIQKDKGILYLPQTHPSVKAQEINKHLATVNIIISTQNPVFPDKSLCITSQLNYSIYKSLKQPIAWQGIGLYRAVRDKKQIDGFRRCHVSDGIAMAKFWAWRSKQDQVDEFQAATYIDNLRLKQKHNKGLSFTTISGGGPNAAVIHYNATQTTSSKITKDMIHLLDSGGQYLDGTTDVTRTYHFGKPTNEQIDSFTRVLKGNLDIELTIWPSTTKVSGGDLDILARRYLWHKNLDYLHGTGHGVGYFQGVHEGPVGISSRNRTVLVPGMIVTNEPGYYEPGKYGIRIENMLLVVEKTPGFYSFENLTLCPYDKALIDKTQIEPAVLKHINDYHDRVYKTIAPFLEEEKDQQSLQWLKKATDPL